MTHSAMFVYPAFLGRPPITYGPCIISSSRELIRSSFLPKALSRRNSHRVPSSLSRLFFCDFLGKSPVARHLSLLDRYHVTPTSPSERYSLILSRRLAPPPSTSTIHHETRCLTSAPLDNTYFIISRNLNIASLCSHPSCQINHLLRSVAIRTMRNNGLPHTRRCFLQTIQFPRSLLR